jgi:hypothetical protein
MITRARGACLALAFAALTAVAEAERLPEAVNTLLDQAKDQRDPGKAAALEDKALEALPQDAAAAVIADAHCRVMTQRILRDEDASAFAVARHGLDAIASLAPPDDGEDVCLFQFVATHLLVDGQIALASNFGRRAAERLLAAENRPVMTRLSLGMSLVNVALMARDEPLRQLALKVINAGAKKSEDKPVPQTSEQLTSEQQDKLLDDFIRPLLPKTEENIAETDASLAKSRKELADGTVAPEDRAEREADLRFMEMMNAQSRLELAGMYEGQGELDKAYFHLRRGLLDWDTLGIPDTIVVAAAREKLIRLEFRRGDVRGALDATLGAMRLIDERAMRAAASGLVRADLSNRSLAEMAVLMAWNWSGDRPAPPQPPTTMNGAQ